MTTGSSGDENESTYDADGFRAFLEIAGVKTVKRMGTARDLASVSLSSFYISLSSLVVKKATDGRDTREKMCWWF